MAKKLVILGGGLSGLTAGEILSKYFKVVILESDSCLGGLASTFEHDGKKIPKYYHHIVRSNRYTQEYLKRFCSEKKLDWKKIKIAIGIDRKITDITSPIDLLKFNYLNFYEKLRFGLFGIYSFFLMNPDRIKENLDAETWLNKYAGKKVTDKIFFHLYSRNKFNIPLSEISAKQFANRLHEKEAQDYFAFPKEGYQCIIDGMEKAIKNNKGFIKRNARISKIDLKKKELVEDGKKIKYDILVSTIPFEIFSGLVKNIPQNLKKDFSKIKYCPAVGLCFGTEQFLKKDLYWINLFNERIHIIMQHSVLNDTYKDKINWCLRYGGSEEDLELSEEEIKEKYLGVVRKYFPDAKIKWAKVFRTKYGEPIYDINYHKYMPNYKSPLEDVYFAGIQITYPKIRNMNVALESGMKVAEIVLGDFKNR